MSLSGIIASLVSLLTKKKIQGCRAEIRKKPG